MYKLFRGKVSKLGVSMAYTGSLAGDGEWGTCPMTCKGCYARKGNFRMPSVQKGLKKMSYGYKYELDKVFSDFEAQIRNARKPITMVRINHSGDFVSNEHLMKWVDLAMKFPSIRFYMYTKRYDFVRNMFAAIDEMPANMFSNISIWGKLGIEEWNEFKHHKNVNAFIVDLDPNNVEYLGRGAVRCLSYDKNGKLNKNHTCDGCQLCFGGSRGTADHLEIHCYKH